MSDFDNGMRAHSVCRIFTYMLYDRGSKHGTGCLFKGGGYSPAQFWDDWCLPAIASEEAYAKLIKELNK